jgi:predicted metal-dependent peptidase
MDLYAGDNKTPEGRDLAEQSAVFREIVAARVKLLFDKPFFGNLATRLNAIEVKWCNTAATDGRNLYYNRAFIKSLSRDQLLFLIGHEVLHCVYDHLGRREGRDPKIWNMANDYIVNWTLKNEKVGVMPEMGLYDPKYTDEMSSEELYELLKKNAVTIKMPLDEHLDLAADGDDEDQGGGGSGDDDGDGNGNMKPGGGGGQKSVDVTIMGKDGPPKLTQEDLQKIRNELRAAVIQNVQSLGAGNVPAGVRRLIHDLIEPKMDWRALLDAHIRSAVKDDYTFQRLSRRSWSSGGALLPAQDFMDTIEVCIGIDASGSMSEEMLRDILSEVKGIMLTFGDFKLKVWSFDTKVYMDSYVEFTPENIDDIDTYPLRGGGGTMFECNWEFMKREDIEPHRFVMFTDGYPGGSWGEENYCDTLFVIHGNKSIVAPFGMTAYYEEKKKR